MDFGNLPAYWQTIGEEFSLLEKLPPLTANHTLSARAFDEAQIAGPRTYMAVTRYLGVARDNHEALLSLLESRGASVWAPWSLLRPTFESAFYACWILDPTDGRIRRARGLQTEIRDCYEQRNHRAAFKAFPDVRSVIEQNERDIDNGSLKTYRSEATALGHKFDTLRQKVNVVQELPKLSFTDKQTAVFLEATWRLLSGFEHGLGWALLSGSDRKTTAHIPGGEDVELVINDDSFVTTAKSTCFLLITACRTLRRRHMSP